ncbi:TP53-regulating kinase-like protein [Zopfochytrium polystomum]|nr:TP53-regulating kinase-like protein [Zopfochytrium polystomum]
MEQIRGVSVKYHIDSRGTSTDLASRIGTFLASMHDLDIIHGDLTSSNMMLREETSSLVIIDFGLSSVSSLAEDKAVDLYVLERALASAHGDVADFFHEVLVVYKSKSKIGKQVLQKLDEVRLRGRKRDMTG